MKYLVTTQLSDLQDSNRIAMVDGTVPGWQPNPNQGDYHYDHHRQGGPEIQIADIDINTPPIADDKIITIVTTQLDADAIVAAAWLQLLPSERSKNLCVLEAIAYDCDHLCVPPRYSDLAEFAAKAVAAMKKAGFDLAKQLNLPADRKVWTEKNRREYYSLGFQTGTEAIIAAAQGKRPWPGESGEADEYFHQLDADANILIQQSRATLFEKNGRSIAVGTTCGMGRYVDPRSFIKAWQKIAGNRWQGQDIEPFTLTAKDHKNGGVSYTLGTIPLHSKMSNLDFTEKVFAALTEAESAKNPNADGWGGRKTVGGSGWNTPSLLTIEQVLEIVSTLV